MIERDELARRLEPVLSETPESARDLMARAGLEANRRIAGVVTVALLQLKREGKARSHGTQPHIKWTRVTTDQGVERLPLARLDAALTLTTTNRTTAGGTRRTELAAVVELGPSWPAGTHPPPRWSTAFSDAQLATGALHGARSNAIARAEAQLRALRKDKTLPLLPTEETMPNRPNPLLLPSKNRETFFSYLASVQPDGARRDSACTRLATLGLATTTAEAERWLDEAVEQGLLAERTKRAGDGTTVVRYLPVEPTTPAPLPKSSAPAVAEPKAKPAPARETRIGKDTYRGAPPKARPAPVADEDTGDPTDDEGALDDPAEHDSEDPPQVEESGEVARLIRERDDTRAQVLELDRGWDASRAELAGALEATPDSSWADLLTRARSVRVEAGILHRQMNEIGEALGLPPNTVSWKLIEAAQVARSQVAAWQNEADSLGRERASLRQQLDAALAAKSPTKHPQHYQGDPAEQFATSIAGWLVGLSDEAWDEVTRARTDLAESRRLREQSHSLELHALDALDRAVGARPAAPPAPVAAPAPDLVPDPIELGPALPATPEPPASGEQANDQAEGGTMLERVRRFFEAHPTEIVNAPTLAERLGCLAKHVSPSLSILFREGFLEKPRLGFYRLARKGRRAA